MEPLHPTLREELKRTYPGLTDADLDRYEQLTSLRFRIDPDASPEEIRRVDAERMQLIRAKMPRLGELENAFFARARVQQRRAKPAPRIETTGPDEPERD
jgi:hypothetical protein